MSTHADAVQAVLAGGPASASKIKEILSLSQPTVSRAVTELGSRVVRLGAARSIQYALRDTLRNLPEMPVYRVDAEGRLQTLGLLIPVRPDGFVMQQTDGVQRHSDGLPWWLFDMRPQGYLGRAYAARHGAALGLPPRLSDWTDTHVLRALLAQGHDNVGNLLLGDAARQAFLHATPPAPISVRRKPTAYAQRAREAAQGEAPGSSAGGEQPKFACYAMTAAGARHLLVKFSESEPGRVSERWRDLLLAEHLALQTLLDADLPAAATQVLDHAGQRFLEIERFDRVGPLGRRGLFSLAALDAEFVGARSGENQWPDLTRRLVTERQVQADAVHAADLLWAFGTLIGNTDMHNGNLSFMTEEGRPYRLAPAYDMTPMAFAPRSGGGLPDDLPDAHLHARIPHAVWHRAEALARDFLARVRATPGFSPRFRPCVAALVRHLDTAAGRIARLG